MFNFISKFVLIGLILNSLIACSGSGGGSSGGDPLIDDNSTGTVNYNTKSCDYKADDGDLADFYQLGRVENLKTSFGKEFNYAFLKAVLKSSVVSTIEFINKTGVNIYKSSRVNSKLCNRPLFANVTALPSDLLTRWKDAGGDSTDDGIILGLYLSQNAKSSEEPSLQNSAAIIVRENTNRWTVVHEFMHHLFMLNAHENGYDEEAVKADYYKSRSEILKIINNKDLSEPELYTQLAKPFIARTKALDTLLVHFTLEEMTIESFLKKSTEDGLLKYAPLNSNWYIQQSASQAKDQYDVSINTLKSILEKLPEKQTDDRQALNTLLDTIKSRLEEINLIQEKYPKTTANLNSFSLGFSKTPEFQKTGCSHEKMSNELLKDTRDLNNIISNTIK